jgi:hypothetical protein
MSLARPLGAKLFLEGLEVPLIGATITHTVNQASIAYVDVVPHEHAYNIKPRTHVVIAVRDYMNPELEYPYVTAWEGEVFGISFGRTTSSRSLSLQCIDYSGYWDNAMLHFLNTMNSGGLGSGDLAEMGLDLEVAKQLNIKTKPVGTSVASFFDNTFDDTIRKGGDFLDAFVAMYKDVTSTNDFFKAGEDRFKITKRFRIKSSGALTELIKDNAAKSWMSGLVNKMGGFTTMRSVVQDLLSLIFHDFVSVPFASSNTYAQRKDKKAEASVAGATVDTAFETIAAKEAGTDGVTTGSFVFKPQLYMCPPPVCNIFFPEEYSSFQYSRNFFREPTRLVYKPVLPQVAAGGERPILPYCFQPDSFKNFMVGNGSGWGPFQNSTDFGVGAGVTFKSYGEQEGATVMRQINFMTNEERLKGMWISMESAVPASNQLDAALENAGKKDFLEKVAKYLLYKKRYQGRTLQITSHLKLSVVPGFPVLVLDDGDTNQNVVAYCDSVTHRIFAQEGGFTSASLSYARVVGEQGVSGEMLEEPVLPPWFDKAVFGAADPKTGEVAALPKTSGLSPYYKELLGTKGFVPITEYYKKDGAPVTLRVAVSRILQEYKSAKKRGAATTQTYIAKVTSRSYTRVRDTFRFLGAAGRDPDTRTTSFMEFSGGPYSTADKVWGSTAKVRRKAVAAYRDAMKNNRGSRG